MDVVCEAVSSSKLEGLRDVAFGRHEVAAVSRDERAQLDESNGAGKIAGLAGRTERTIDRDGECVQLARAEEHPGGGEEGKCPPLREPSTRKGALGECDGASAVDSFVQLHFGQDGQQAVAAERRIVSEGELKLTGRNISLRNRNFKPGRPPDLSR